MGWFDTPMTPPLAHKVGSGFGDANAASSGGASFGGYTPPSYGRPSYSPPSYTPPSYDQPSYGAPTSNAGGASNGFSMQPPPLTGGFVAGANPTQQTTTTQASPAVTQALPPQSTGTSYTPPPLEGGLVAGQMPAQPGLLPPSPLPPATKQPGPMPPVQVGGAGVGVSGLPWMQNAWFGQ